MATSDKRSYNNADLTAMQVQGFKNKGNRGNSVQLKVGSTKISLPVEAHLLTTESGFAFLSVQPINAVLGKKADGSFEAVNAKERDAAVAALKSYRGKGGAVREGKSTAALTAEAKKQLAAIIPPGHKLVLKGNEYTLVKARTRKNKA